MLSPAQGGTISKLNNFQSSIYFVYLQFANLVLLIFTFNIKKRLNEKSMEMELSEIQRQERLVQYTRTCIPFKAIKFQVVEFKTFEILFGSLWIFHFWYSFRFYREQTKRNPTEQKWKKYVETYGWSKHIASKVN